MRTYRKKKSLGQNFLVDESISSLIIDSLGISTNNHVIEVGPGDGSLTRHIIDKCPKSLVLIEKDNQLSFDLSEKYPDLRVINDDATGIDLQNIYIDENDLYVVSNLPYNVSTVILENLVRQYKKIKKMVLMFQKEVALRVVAGYSTSSYGRLSLLAQEFYNVSRVLDVSPDKFSPVPKVNSMVLLFERLDSPLINVINRQVYSKLIKLMFLSRRKMIRKILKSVINEYDADMILKECNLSGELRPQDLSIQDYANLSDYIAENNDYTLAFRSLTW